MLALLALALAAAPVATPVPVLTPEALRARYGGLRRLSADVIQVKEGRYWARPFETRVKLRYTPDVHFVSDCLDLEDPARRIVLADQKRRFIGTRHVVDFDDS